MFGNVKKVEFDKARKLWYLFLRNFWPLEQNTDWTLDCVKSLTIVSIQIFDFPNIS